MAINITLRLKKELKTKPVIFGTKRTLKNLNSLEKIYIAVDCPVETREEIKNLLNYNNIEITELEFSKEELRDICKKPFNISVLSILRQKGARYRGIDEKVIKKKEIKRVKEKEIGEVKEEKITKIKKKKPKKKTEKTEKKKKTPKKKTKKTKTKKK